MLPLASIHFADPLMLIGLLAGAIPIALHLLNRIRSPIVPFPTLRFLKITAQKTSRRRQIQSWLLLLLRVAVFAIIAMALASPLIHGGRPEFAYALILLLLAAAALLTLAAVFFTTALDHRKSAPAPDPLMALRPLATGHFLQWETCPPVANGHVHLYGAMVQSSSQGHAQRAPEPATLPRIRLPRRVPVAICSVVKKLHYT